MTAPPAALTSLSVLVVLMTGVGLLVFGVWIGVDILWQWILGRRARGAFSKKERTNKY